MTGPSFGIAYNGYEEAARVADFVRSVEPTFDSIWVNENVHTAIPHLDPLVTLGAIAAASDRISIGTAAVLLPLMNPVWLARAALTLQRLSGGRLILGVANGGGAPEGFSAYGVPLAERASRAEEYIAVMRKLWAGGPVNHEGRYVRLDGFEIGGGGRPPLLWLAGTHARVAERAGRLADGFLPIRVPPSSCSRLYATVAHSAEGVGRDGSVVRRAVYVYAYVGTNIAASLHTATEVLYERYARRIKLQPGVDAAVGPPGACEELLAEYVDAGVEHLVLDLCCPSDELSDQCAAIVAVIERLSHRELRG